MSTLPAIDTAATLETLLKSDKVHRNLHSGVLVEQAIRRGEGLLADNGALVGYTGKFTGRIQKKKFTVKDPVTSELVN
jgi:phosphoenolpyruvate carboxykinase (ATP)